MMNINRTEPVSVPHRHLGQAELCYDRLCARITADEAIVGAIGALAFVGILALAAGAISA